MSNGDTERRSAKLVEGWLVSVTDTFGLPRPARVASHYSPQFMATRAVIYYDTERGSVMYTEHLFDAAFFEHPCMNVFEEIAFKLAIDARIPIAEEL